MVEEKKMDKKKEEKTSGKIKKGDFVEMKFTGYVNGEVFDSNIEEDYKKLDPEGKGKVKKMVIVVGEGMVVSGLDKGLEGKEVGKEYKVSVSAKDGFGGRRRELIRVLPLAKFSEKKVEPRAGMVLALDDNIVKIIAVSGARVTTDFNSPLAGKDLEYKFTITRKVTEDKEKAGALFEILFSFVPSFEIKGKKVVIKGQAGMGEIVKVMGGRFKELTGLELGFEEAEKKKEGQ
jgi:FKBP-type peptidyl-prolyl cis-trans isomerase 2